MKHFQIKFFEKVLNNCILCTKQWKQEVSIKEDFIICIIFLVSHVTNAGLMPVNPFILFIRFLSILVSSFVRSKNIVNRSYMHLSISIFKLLVHFKQLHRMFIVQVPFYQLYYVSFKKCLPNWFHILSVMSQYAKPLPLPPFTFCRPLPLPFYNALI